MRVDIVRTLALFSCFTIALVACGPSDGGPQAEADPLDEYISVFKGDLTIEPFVDSEDSVELSPSTWRELVREYRRLGAGGLETEARRELLVGAFKSFAILTTEMDWDVSATFGENSVVGSITENFEPAAAAPVFSLVSREQSIPGVRLDWGGYAFQVPGLSAKKLIITDQHASKYEDWALWPTGWTCKPSTADFDLFRLAYVTLIGGYINGVVVEQNVSNITLRATTADGAEVTYLLGSNSLWLETIEVVPKRENAGVARMTLRARNLATEVERPRDACA